MLFGSFSGIGTGKNSVDEHVDTIMKGNPRALGRWRAAKVLIIDEISMIDAQLFDKLEQIARRLRGNSDKPFGGIQLLVSCAPNGC